MVTDGVGESLNKGVTVDPKMCLETLLDKVLAVAVAAKKGHPEAVERGVSSEPTVNTERDGEGVECKGFSRSIKQ